MSERSRQIIEELRQRLAEREIPSADDLRAMDAHIASGICSIANCLSQNDRHRYKDKTLERLDRFTRQAFDMLSLVHHIRKRLVEAAALDESHAETAEDAEKGECEQCGAEPSRFEWSISGVTPVECDQTQEPWRDYRQGLLDGASLAHKHYQMGFTQGQAFADFYAGQRDEPKPAE